MLTLDTDILTTLF